jgi:hypothetical protein
MAFERKKLPNGNINPKYVDLCDEDPPIAGQKFTCMSFISPEKILKKRELFLFEQFLKQWEFTKSTGKMMDFLHFLAYKYNLQMDQLTLDFNEFVKDEEVKLKETSVDDDYKTFIDKYEDKLTEQFNQAHAFQTSVRGLKIRGVFNTQEEAEMRCKKIREFDPNHDIFVGPIGMWIPCDPDAYKTGRVEFMEEELNQLHSEKIKNEAKATEEFQRRIKETKQKAIKENIELAKKSGNVLTQTLDENGELVGVMQNVNFDERTLDSNIKEKNEALRDSKRVEELYTVEDFNPHSG